MSCHSCAIEVYMRSITKILIALVVTLSLLSFPATVNSHTAPLHAVYLPMIMRSPVPLTALRLAFTTQDQIGYREIYTMRGDGSEQTRLTNNQAHNSDPVWSPQ